MDDSGRFIHKKVQETPESLLTLVDEEIPKKMSIVLKKLRQYRSPVRDASQYAI